MVVSFETAIKNEEYVPGRKTVGTFPMYAHIMGGLLTASRKGAQSRQFLDHVYGHALRMEKPHGKITLTGGYALELRVLKYFLIVAREENFTRAANFCM